MEILEFIRSLDDQLESLASAYGPWIYVILFLIIFCETGLVIMPFLPGDSLLFAVGSVASREGAQLSITLLWGLLLVAGILGDTVNYHVGQYLGPRVLSSETSRWLNRKHLDYTREFFEKYGSITIVLARFMPILRTFAPFVAGVGAMNYSRFLVYNVAGGFIWVTLFVWGGYLFGQIPAVKENFELVIVVIVVLSCVPIAFATWARMRSTKETPSAP